MSVSVREFSRPFKVTRLSDVPLTLDLSASAQELGALARRLDIPEVTSLQARLEISGSARDVRVQGVLKALLVQNCVVTLEPVSEHYEESFSRRFLPPSRLPELAPGEEVFVHPDDEDAPDMLEGDEIDLGEVVAEELALVLNPYPRKPGVAFAADDEAEATALDKSPGEAEGGLKPNPFAVLSKLKEKG